MAEIIVKVPDNEVSYFMNLLQKLGYTADGNLPQIKQWQLDLVEERMQEYKKNPYPLKDANEVMDDIIKKL